MFTNINGNRLLKPTTWLMLGVLVLGPVACSLAFNHMWLHTQLGNSPCIIPSFITSSIFGSSTEYLALTLGWIALLLIFFLFDSDELFIKQRTRLPAWFFWRYNLDHRPRNYILLAFSQGILHPRVY